MIFLLFEIETLREKQTKAFEPWKWTTTINIYNQQANAAMALCGIWLFAQLSKQITVAKC
jgi:hypothetical protein